MNIKEAVPGTRVYWPGEVNSDADSGVIVNHDGEAVTFTNYDGKTHVWVRWDSDGNTLHVELEELEFAGPIKTRDLTVEECIIFLLDHGYSVSKNGG